MGKVMTRNGCVYTMRDTIAKKNNIKDELQSSLYQ